MALRFYKVLLQASDKTVGKLDVAEKKLTGLLEETYFPTEVRKTLQQVLTYVASAADLLADESERSLEAYNEDDWEEEVWREVNRG